MQDISIDLRRNPELADLLVDMKPGDKIYLCTSIKNLDDQTADLTIEGAYDDTKELHEDETTPEEDGDGDKSPKKDGADGDDEAEPGDGNEGSGDERNRQGDMAGRRGRYSGDQASVRGREDAAI